MIEPVVVLLAEESFCSHFLGRVVVEVAQVAVELHLGREDDANDDDDDDERKEPRLPVEGQVVDAYDAAEGLAVGVGMTFGQEMGQEDEGEEGAAQQGERGKHTEVAK